MLFIFVVGIILITKGWTSWDDLKPKLNAVIKYEFLTEIIWFVNLFIGYFYYYHIGRKKIESKHTIVQTMFPPLDSILTVVTYATIINSTFYLADEMVNGELIKVSFDWLSLFIAVFIILFWCLKRLWDMSVYIVKIMMERSEKTSVQSSNINSISYDDKTNTLVIEFMNSSTYKYLDVPEQVYADFLAAQSHGKFVSDNIKGKYPFEKMN